MRSSPQDCSSTLDRRGYARTKWVITPGMKAIPVHMILTRRTSSWLSAGGKDLRRNSGTFQSVKVARRRT